MLHTTVSCRRHSIVAAVAGLLLALVAPLAMAATAGGPPVLRAHARVLDVRDGRHLWKGIWTVDPGVKLDVYYAQRSNAPKTVTFLSGVDSLSIRVVPGHEYDFVVLLDDTTRCRTRISTFRWSARQLGPGPARAAVEIPFTIGREGKIRVEGRVNGSFPLSLTFDTGAFTTVLYPSARGKQARVEFDGTTENSGTGGTVTRRTSNDNILEVGPLSWAHAPVLFVEKQADPSDGILGIDVFEDKVVELDFERNVMTIHDSLPGLDSSFVRVPLEWKGTLPCVPVTLDMGTTTAVGSFVLDTGSNGTLNVTQAFAAANGLPGTLERLGVARVGGTGLIASRADRVVLPAFTLAGVDFPDVPIVVERRSEQGSQFGNLVGMQVLDRYRVVLDLRGDALYLRPGPNARAPFPRPDRRRWLWPVVGLVFIVGTAVSGWLAARAARSPRTMKGVTVD